MGPEVIVFAIGFYVGWALFVVCASLTILRATRYFAAPVLVLGTTAGFAATWLNWGVPWSTSFPLVFATVAIPTAGLSMLIAVWIFMLIPFFDRDAA